jgi:hypothetical protein
MFMRMLHDWNDSIWGQEEMFMWMLHDLKLLEMKSRENICVNVTWIETIEYW